MKYHSLITMKAVGYARVSRESENIENQINNIREYAKKNNIEIVDIFQDINISGTIETENREGFKEMLEFCKQNNINTILCYDLSRLSRSVLDGLKTLKELEDKGFRVIFTSQDFLNYIEDKMMRKKILMDFLWFAEMYVEDIKKRTRERLKQLREMGMKLGRKRKIKDEDLDLVLDLIRLGYTQRDIAKRFNCSERVVWQFLKEKTKKTYLELKRELKKKKE